MKTLALLVMLSVVCASLGAEPPAARLAVTARSAPLPQRLSDTGLYVADSIRVRADNIAFAPQYPLWSDGTSKRRWIYLPPSTEIEPHLPHGWDCRLMMETSTRTFLCADLFTQGGAGETR